MRELLTKEWQWSIASHLEKDATEAAVNAVRSPGGLHLATHGFFLPQTRRTDPLERSRGSWESAAVSGGQGGPSLEDLSDVVLDNPCTAAGSPSPEPNRL